MVGLLPPRFVRARLQPCRTARKIRAALAAEVRFSSCHTDSLSLDGKSPSELGLQPLEGATGSQRTGEPFDECFSRDGALRLHKGKPVLFPIRAALCAM